MPFSHKVFDPVVEALFRRIRPASLLDVGAGSGKYGAMMRRLEGELTFSCRKVGVEITGAYVDSYGLAAIYDDIWVRDVYSLLSSAPDLSGDVVVLGDVLEHLPKSRGIDLIEYLLYRFKYLIAIFPVDLVQGAWEGNPAEAHVSLWYPEDLSRYRASVCTADTGEGWNKCLALLNGVATRPADRLHLQVNGQQATVGNA